MLFICLLCFQNYALQTFVMLSIRKHQHNTSVPYINLVYLNVPVYQNGEMLHVQESNVTFFLLSFPFPKSIKLQ